MFRNPSFVGIVRHIKQQLKSSSIKRLSAPLFESSGFKEPNFHIHANHISNLPFNDVAYICRMVASIREKIRWLPFSAKHVIIFNKLVTRATLVLHCRNKGEDKGVFSLGPGDSFDFRFRVNLRKTTQHLISLELIETIIRKAKLEFAVNVFGAFTNQHHVEIDVMEYPRPMERPRLSSNGYCGPQMKSHSVVHDRICQRVKRGSNTYQPGDDPYPDPNIKKFYRFFCCEFFKQSKARLVDIYSFRSNEQSNSPARRVGPNEQYNSPARRVGPNELDQTSSLTRPLGELDQPICLHPALVASSFEIGLNSLLFPLDQSHRWNFKNRKNLFSRMKGSRYLLNHTPSNHNTQLKTKKIRNRKREQKEFYSKSAYERYNMVEALATRAVGEIPCSNNLRLQNLVESHLEITKTENIPGKPLIK
ncbi:hypothetical protein YC2023_051409 [Brassica napus]